jgi:hypothetical protein
MSITEKISAMNRIPPGGFTQIIYPPNAIERNYIESIYQTHAYTFIRIFFFFFFSLACIIPAHVRGYDFDEYSDRQPR